VTRTIRGVILWQASVTPRPSWDNIIAPVDSKKFSEEEKIEYVIITFSN